MPVRLLAQIFHAGTGWTVLLITMKVLEHNFMLETLPDTIQVSQRQTGDPVFGGVPKLWYQLARQQEQATAYFTAQ